MIQLNQILSQIRRKEQKKIRIHKINNLHLLTMKKHRNKKLLIKLIVQKKSYRRLRKDLKNSEKKEQNLRTDLKETSSHLKQIN